MMRTDKIESLRKRVSNALASLNVLFEAPGDSKNRIVDIDRRDFVILLKQVLCSILKDLDSVYGNSSATRFWEVVDNHSDSIDYINELARFCHGRSLTGILEASIMDLTAMEEDFFGQLKSRNKRVKDLARYKFAHADRLCTCCATLIPDYLNLQEMTAGVDEGLSRVSPDCYDLVCSDSAFSIGDSKLTTRKLTSLRKLAGAADPFRLGRTFRYCEGGFYPVELNSIRSVDKFYGYPLVKELFEKHFEAFVRGEDNIPLLITSLPGLGKTHFAIAYTLAHQELTLILPEPEDLERNLVNLIRRLEKRKNHKFVVFFDDIDAREVDWYYFRTHVGGSFVLPQNITILIASNYRFPANICSRGREVTYPVFDENACCGMIFDYLKSLKIRKPSNDLIAVMAAGYLEQYGQKVYAELSPRSLVRYLEKFDRDLKMRKKMLELSREDVTTRPDTQMFHEFNVKMIRQLYGEEGIKELRERMLGES